MTDHPLPQRKSPRLPGYDYSQSGAYFVTICTHQRFPWFGDVVNGVMDHRPLGMLAAEELARIPDRWSGIDLDAFVLMPNHVHAIIVIVGTPSLPHTAVGTPFLASDSPPFAPLVSDSPPPLTPAMQNHVPALGTIIGTYKAGVTRLARLHHLLDDPAILWQGRYHDHIIRDEQSLNHIRDYIQTNPARWRDDTFFTG